jgi:hypothetical protein
LSSRKKARVPSTFCSKVGSGSLSNSAVMVGLSPSIQPVALPSPSRASLPRGGTSASLLMSSAWKPAGDSSAAA